MSDQGTGFDVVIERLDDTDEPLLQVTARRMLGARYSLLPHEVRFAINNPGDPVADQVMTVSNTVVGLTIPDLALSATIQVQSNPIRWSLGTTVPDATHGFHNDALALIQLQGMPSLKSFRAIREGAADATLYIVFFD